jgi:hypothetical protein
VKDRQRSSEANEAPRAARSLTVARIAIPVVLAVVGYAVLIASRFRVEHELQSTVADLARVTSHESWVQWIGALAALVGIAVFGVTMLRRDRTAADRARQVMLAVGTRPRTRPLRASA